jgi:hypothetical protein
MNMYSGFVIPSSLMLVRLGPFVLRHFHFVLSHLSPLTYSLLCHAGALREGGSLLFAVSRRSAPGADGRK